MPFPTDISDDPSDRRVEMMTGLLLPVSSGELRLTSKDATVQPFLDYNYLADPFDRERLRAAVRMCLQLGESDELKGIIGERVEPADADLQSDDALDQWMLREAHTYSHISGTCKMGPSSDPMSVVDQYGMVYGLGGTAGGRCLHHARLGSGGHQPHGVDDGRAFGRFCGAGLLTHLDSGGNRLAAGSVESPGSLSSQTVTRLTTQITARTRHGG